MNATELDRCLKSLFTVNEDTIDGILAGAPEREVTKVGTCWLPYLDTLKKMSNDGVNVVVCHEPLFYASRDWNKYPNDVKAYCEDHNLQKTLAKFQYQVTIKNKWIYEHNMTIIRSHDAIDKEDCLGITVALAHLIGLNDKKLINKKGHILVYGIKEVTAVEVVKNIAEKLMPLKQGSVSFYGNLNYHVNSIGICAGCDSNPLDIMDLGADFCVTITDAMKKCISGAFANDTGLPIAVIDQGVSEETGVMDFSNYLANKFDFPVAHFPQGSGYITFWS